MGRALLAAVAGLLVAAAPAGAQSFATASPATPGKPTILHYELDSSAAPLNGRIPGAFALSAPAGMTFNTKAVPKTCNTRRKAWGDCSIDSLIGRGTMSVTVTADPLLGSASVYKQTLPINVFRGDANQVVAFTIIDEQVKLAPGTMSTSNGFGFTLILPLVQQYRNVAITLDRITMDLGASRNVRERYKVRRKGKTRIRHRTVHRDLLRLPKTCGTGGVWASSMTLIYADQSSVSVPTPIACATA